MSSKLTVLFYIVLCLEAGLVLTVLPWVHPFGLGDWGDNYFLLYASQKIGMQGLQYAISSGWVRGAVTGLGLLNLAMASWEIVHFRQTVRTLEMQERNALRTNASPATSSVATSAADVSATPTTDHVSDHERGDDQRANASGQ